VFESRVLRKISGPKRDEVTVEWRKLNNEELSDLSSSPNIIRVYTGFWCGNLRERDHFEDPGLDGRIILR
jgi:hypothetical protein